MRLCQVVWIVSTNFWFASMGFNSKVDLVEFQGTRPPNCTISTVLPNLI